MRVGWNHKIVIRIRKSIRKRKLLLSPSLKKSSQGKDTLLRLLFPPTSPKQFWHNFGFCVVVEGDDWKPLSKYILLSSQKKMQGHSETSFYFTVGRTWGCLAIKITKQVTYLCFLHYAYILFHTHHLVWQNCLHTNKLQNYFQSYYKKGKQGLCFILQRLHMNHWLAPRVYYSYNGL